MLGGLLPACMWSRKPCPIAPVKTSYNIRMLRGRIPYQRPREPRLRYIPTSCLDVFSTTCILVTFVLLTRKHAQMVIRHVGLVKHIALLHYCNVSGVSSTNTIRTVKCRCCRMKTSQDYPYKLAGKRQDRRPILDNDQRLLSVS